MHKLGQSTTNATSRLVHSWTASQWGMTPGMIVLHFAGWNFIYVPSRKLTYPTLGSLENHLQIWLLRGYVSSQEGSYIAYNIYFFRKLPWNLYSAGLQKTNIWVWRVVAINLFRAKDTWGTWIPEQKKWESILVPSWELAYTIYIYTP